MRDTGTRDAGWSAMAQSWSEPTLLGTADGLNQRSTQRLADPAEQGCAIARSGQAQPLVVAALSGGDVP